MHSVENPKNVLHLSVTTIIGGGSEYLYSLLKGFMKYQPDYKFMVVCPHDGIYFDKMQDLGVDVINLPIRSLRFRNILELLAICRNNNITLIHAHGKGAGLYGRIVGAMLNIPVVYTFHGFHFEHYHILLQKIYLMYEKLMRPLTSQYMLVSEGERKKIRAMGICLDDSKLTVVHNGVECERVEGAIADRAIFGFSQKDIIIITLSRVSQQKGIEYLVAAAQKVVEKFPLAKFIVLGDPTEDEDNYKGEDKYRQQIMNQIKTLNLDQNVIIMKKRSDALHLVAAADLYITSSLGEGFSLSLLEAMLLVRPIVATDVVGNNEAIVHMKTGILVPSRDADALADGIIKMLKCPTLARELSLNARAYAEENFSYGKMIIKTKMVYENVFRLKGVLNG